MAIAITRSAVLKTPNSARATPALRYSEAGFHSARYFERTAHQWLKAQTAGMSPITGRKPIIPQTKAASDLRMAVMRSMGKNLERAFHLGRRVGGLEPLPEAGTALVIGEELVIGPVLTKRL